MADAGGFSLEHQFHAAMLELYDRAKQECGYNATRFLHIISSEGGLAAAKSLLAAQGMSEGLTILWEKRQLDLSMEALVLREPWRTLFTEAELASAELTLRNLGYFQHSSR